jgi:hypothetical protein
MGLDDIYFEAAGLKLALCLVFAWRAATTTTQRGLIVAVPFTSPDA